MEFASIGSIILDDIVFPDSLACSGILGGGAVHAGAGIRLWTDKVSILSAVGSDFPPDLWTKLEAVFDLGNVSRYEAPTPRARQVYDVLGNRTEVFRTDWTQFTRLFVLRPASLIKQLAIESGVFLLSGQPDNVSEWVAYFRANGSPVVLWEPWDVFMEPENRLAFRKIAPLVDIVSPNLIEAQRMTGEDTSSSVVRALLADGARVIALRMGEKGSIVARVDELIEIPTVSPGIIKDPTGAGNAYCGGFLAGFVESDGNLRYAGLYGAVAASFALSQIGAFLPDGSTRVEAHKRLKPLVR